MTVKTPSNITRTNGHYQRPGKSGKNNNYREFVNTLNKRVKGKENLVLILEIYNKLIKFEAISFLKQSLTKLVVKNPEDLHTFDKTSRREFEKSLNLQEIIYSIIYNQEMVFIRNYLKEIFKFGDLFEEIEKSIDQLDEIEKEDHSYDAQDYDELREFQYLGRATKIT